jgi:hemerythrin superfamily protein
VDKQYFPKSSATLTLSEACEEAEAIYQRLKKEEEESRKQEAAYWACIFDDIQPQYYDPVPLGG